MRRLLVSVVTRAAFRHETVCESYLQSRIAVGVLEQSGALYTVRILHTVEFVTKREMYRPLQSEVQPFSYFIFHAQAERKVCCKHVVGVCLYVCCAKSEEYERSEALGSSVLTARAIRPEVVFISYSEVDERVAEFNRIVGILGIPCLKPGRAALQLSV